MIELLAAQTITNLALAAVVIKLRRELWPMIAGVGPVSAGFWLRSVDVLAVQAPQFDVAKTVIKVRWLFSEELHLTYKFRVYDIAMDPVSRLFYKEWREWVGGSTKYDCRVKKPRGLSRLYSKAIDVFCKEKKPPKEVVILPSRWRKRRYKR